MDFVESLTGRMPPVREDEPPGLRQDIFDELKDHLAASLQRELLRSGDPATARARVLERFGDPAAVACRLWLDAMRGKIMGQRVLIRTCVLVAAASVLAVAILWQELVQARRMAADQAAAQVALLAARDRETLQQLKALSESVHRLGAPNLSEVRINLADDSTEARPVEGASVEIISLSEEPVKRVKRMSDAFGRAIFGALSSGEYELSIERHWAQGTMTTTSKFDVQPGIDVNKQIGCPTVPPREGSVRIKWQWPEDLGKEALVINASFGFRDVESASGLRWNIHRDSSNRRSASQNSDDPTRYDWFPLAHSILCGPSEKLARFRMSRGLFVWKISSGNDDSISFGSLDSRRGPDTPDPREFAHALEEEIESSTDRGPLANLEVGNYELIELLVLRPVLPSEIEEGVRRFSLLAAVRPRFCVRDLHKRSKAPTKVEQKAESYTRVGAWKVEGVATGPFSRDTVELPREFWAADKNRFEVKHGNMSEWTIPLPDELVQAVRAALKADKAEKNKSLSKVKGTSNNG